MPPRSLTVWTCLLPLIACVLATAPGLHADPQIDWRYDIEAAQQEARDTDRDVLLNFTGTGWCPNCKLLKEQVLSQPAVIDWINQHFVAVFLDYTPQIVPVHPEFTDQHAQIIKKYGFYDMPRLLMTDADGRAYAMTGYLGDQLDTAGYLQHYEQLRARHEQRDRFLDQARQADDPQAQAAALDAALDPIDPLLVLIHHRAEVDQLASLKTDDPDYARKYREQGAAALTQQIRSAQYAGDAPAALEKIATLLQDYVPDPALRQKLLATRGQILLAVGRAAEAHDSVQQAIDAAPESNLVAKLEAFRDKIQQQLGSDSAAPNS